MKNITHLIQGHSSTSDIYYLLGSVVEAAYKEEVYCKTSDSNTVYILKSPIKAIRELLVGNDILLKTPLYLPENTVKDGVSQNLNEIVHEMLDFWSVERIDHGDTLISTVDSYFFSKDQEPADKNALRLVTVGVLTRMLALNLVEIIYPAEGERNNEVKAQFPYQIDLWERPSTFESLNRIITGWQDDWRHGFTSADIFWIRMTDQGYQQLEAYTLAGKKSVLTKVGIYGSWNDISEENT